MRLHLLYYAPWTHSHSSRFPTSSIHPLSMCLSSLSVRLSSLARQAVSNCCYLYRVGENVGKFIRNAITWATAERTRVDTLQFAQINLTCLTEHFTNCAQCKQFYLTILRVAQSQRDITAIEPQTIPNRQLTQTCWYQQKPTHLYGVAGCRPEILSNYSLFPNRLNIFLHPTNRSSGFCLCEPNSK